MNDYTPEEQLLTHLEKCEVNSMAAAGYVLKRTPEILRFVAVLRAYSLERHAPDASKIVHAKVVAHAHAVADALQARVDALNQKAYNYTREHSHEYDRRSRNKKEVV